jgi:hypothetical protein
VRVGIEIEDGPGKPGPYKGWVVDRYSRDEPAKKRVVLQPTLRDFQECSVDD